MSLVLISILVSVILILISIFYIRIFQIYAKPDEWLLVMRNGKVVAQGIGISFVRRIGDMIVKFPSIIHTVEFSAQQTTKEKQGIEIKGVIIWQIFRTGEGPFKAYRSLGEDLSRDIPVNTNKTFQQMTNSIVRHRIANSTIQEIMTKREELRKEMKKELNQMLNGWGVWVESVEITDVMISSKTLFENMQVEFRENQRNKAEMIKMNINNKIENELLKKDNEINQNKTDANRDVQMFNQQQNFKLQEEEQKIKIEQNKLEKIKIDDQYILNRYVKEQDNDYINYCQQQEKENTFDKIENDKKIVNKNQELIDINFQREKQNDFDEMEIKILNGKHNLKIQEMQLLMENEIFEEMSDQCRNLQTIEKICENLPVREIKIVNTKENDSIGDALQKFKQIWNNEQDQFI